MRKFLSLIMIIILFMSGALTGNASTGLNQDSPSVWAKDTVQEAIKLGIVPKRLQSNYRKPITREEYSELVVNSLLLETCSDPDEHDQPPRYYGMLNADLLVQKVKAPDFQDCKLAHVKAAYIMGIVNGTSPTTFSPYTSITRQEAAALMSKYAQVTDVGLTYGDIQTKYKDFKDIDDWAKDAVSICLGNGIMNGTGTGFSPKDTFTREQAIVTVKQAHKSFTSYIYLRGHVAVSVGQLAMGWEVGSDWVAVHYDTVKNRPLNPGVSNTWDGICKSYKVDYFEPSSDQFNLFLAARSVRLFPLDLIKKQQHFAVNSDTLISDWFSEDWLLKYTLVQNLGYISREKGAAFYSKEKIRANAEVIQ